MTQHREPTAPRRRPDPTKMAAERRDRDENEHRDDEPSGHLLSPEEKLDEASRDSMDASDPPARPMRVGGPSRAPEPDEGGIRKRARELWEADGMPSGGEEPYRVRAEMDQRAAAVAKPKIPT